MAKNDTSIMTKTNTPAETKPAKAKKEAVGKELKLEAVLFSCRDLLRGKASMADKRDMLLTLVFLRFVGEKFDLQRQRILRDFEQDGFDLVKDQAYIAAKIEDPNFYEDVFYLSPECRWETVLAMKADATLNTQLDTILNRMEQEHTTLRGALPQKIFTSANVEPKVIKSVIDEVNKITNANFHEGDLIGRVYEYFLQAFAVNAEKEEGEFYTPHCIVELISSLIEPFDGTLYDPACGSGGMFVQSMRLIEAHGGNTKAVNVYGQESQPETYRLAKMNLAVRGISHNLGEQPASSFTNDQHIGRWFNYIMANPPFNLKKWRTDEELTTDYRWDGYGLPPVSNANYAWILHILAHLEKQRGVAGFLLANGALGDEDTRLIRQRLIENDKVEAIIILPREMFYATDISVTLWILNQNKRGGEWHGRKQRNREGEILFMDLRTWNTYIATYKKDKGQQKSVVLTPEQIAEVVRIYQTWQAEGTDGTAFAKPELYRSVLRDEIEEKGWSLVPSKYIEFVDHDLDIDYSREMERIQGEMRSLLADERKSQEELRAAFRAIGYEIEETI